jgi:RNA 2',3'-cyclic 3'-phosphodiesterase
VIRPTEGRTTGHRGRTTNPPGPDNTPARDRLVGMRLFVAIWPPPPVVAALSELEHPDVGTVRWTAPSRWHVTLLFLGQPASSETDDQVPPAGSADPASAVDGAKARLRRVPLEAHIGTVARLGAVTACFGRSVLIVPVLGLDALAEAVRMAYSPGAARSAGTDPAGTDPMAFNGHLTVGRARRRRDDLRPLAGEPVGSAAGMEWAVDEVALVASTSRDGKGVNETLSTISVPGGHYPTSNMRSGLQ